MSVIKQIEIQGSSPISVDLGADAENVSYDNTGSGLNNTNLQDALDELVAQGGYAVCSTLGATAAKEASITGYSLRVGAKIAIKFENENSASNPTLNISATGAKPLIFNGEAANDVIKANSVFLINYNGTSYDLVGGAAGDDSFIGTTAEWEALSSAEKAKYDGKLVYITDDYNPTIEGKSIRACYDETTALYEHAVDDIIYINKHFYIVIATINVGDTIAVGTNIVAANLPVNSIVAVDKIPE